MAGKWYLSDEKWIRRKHAYYYEELQKLGKFPLAKDVTIEELKLPQTIIKTGYRDIKKLGFHKKMSLIELLQFVSFQKVMMDFPDIDTEDPDVRNALKLSARRPDLLLPFPGIDEFDKLRRTWTAEDLTEFREFSEKRRELLCRFYYNYLHLLMDERFSVDEIY